MQTEAKNKSPITPVAARRPLFRSLKTKIALLSMLIMFLVLMVFSAVFVYGERNEERDGLLENGQAFARFSSIAIYDEYVDFYTKTEPENFNVFRQRVNDILSYNKDITDISLVSVNGQVLFDSDEFKTGKYVGPVRTIDDEATLRAARSNEVAVRDVVIDGGTFAEIVVPLSSSGDGHVLSMRYLMSYDALSQRLQEVYQRAVLMVLLLLLLVALAAAWFAQSIARPIVGLTRVAERIRGGDLTARAPVGSDDEIGRLSIVWNDMTDKLKSSYQNLEAKVRERTRDLEAAQAKLTANIKQDEALIESIGEGLVVTDQAGYIILVNKVAEDMLQVKKDDVYGKKIEKVWAIEDEQGNVIPNDERPLYRAIKLGTPLQSSDYYYARRNKSGIVFRYPTAITVAPVILNGETQGAINIFRDITHEKQVDRMKTEFISLASHQLRTPLSAIKWFIEMLINGDAGKLTDEQMEFAKNVSASTERMIDLVNSLLNISRIESGRIIVDPKPTNVDELVSGIVSDLKAKIEDRQQTLIVSVHKDLPKINLDPHLIGQVYLNFLTNAIKYTPKGGEISVFVSRKDEELVSQITDNGYGIPKTEQEKLFQKFFRATNVVKVETDGTGLGLYLVKAIIESSGGRVWFESEEGKGTTFWFSLPMSGMKAREGEVALDM